MHTYSLSLISEILREDRIFIRNRIKENDSEVLSFFKPLKNISTLDDMFRHAESADQPQEVPEQC